MDAEWVRERVLKLPHVVETMQWGANLVFWVGEKAIGGKMFALADLNDNQKAVLSFAAGPERYAELLEVDGIIPAPYLARAHWVAMRHWRALPGKDLEEHLHHAHSLIWQKLSKRTREQLIAATPASKKLSRQRKTNLS